MFIFFNFETVSKIGLLQVFGKLSSFNGVINFYCPCNVFDALFINQLVFLS
jgi:hypothetical protein